MAEAEKLRGELLSTYAAGPDMLEKALTGLSGAGLDRGAAEGGWTIRQIVHHLADGEGVLTTCFKMTLAAPGSTFDMGWYVGTEGWAEALDYGGRDIGAALALFRANRRYVAELMAHLTEEWESPASIVFPGAKSGRPMTAGRFIQLWVEHLQEHLEQIEQIRREQAI